MPCRTTTLALIAFVSCIAAFSGADAHAQAAPKNRMAATPDKIDPLTPAKKRMVDAFIDSLELAPNWPHYVEESQQAFADDVRSGIVNGAQLDDLPADKRAKADAVVDEMIPHIVQDMKTELLKVDAVAFYHELGYDVYGKHFTTRELKDLTAIYGSPLYHRTMPRIFEQRQIKPDSTDDDLRQLVGNADFDALAKAMQRPAFIKMLKIAPAAAEATSEYVGALVGKVSESVGRSYSTILLEKLKEIRDEAPEGKPEAPPENAPASVQVNAPASAEKATQ
jgi:hypothetical protein